MSQIDIHLYAITVVSQERLPRNSKWMGAEGNLQTVTNKQNKIVKNFTLNMIWNVE